MDFEQVDERQSEDSGRDDHGDGPVDAGTQCHDSVGSHSSERGLPVPLMSVDPFAIEISIPFLWLTRPSVVVAPPRNDHNRLILSCSNAIMATPRCEAVALALRVGCS